MNKQRDFKYVLKNSVSPRSLKKYTPSNGTEGMIFQGNWCDKCSKEKRCPILTDKLLNGSDSKRKEWVYKNDKPVCKNFKKIGTPNKKRNPLRNEQTLKLNL